jgi:hypothetical protein
MCNAGLPMMGTLTGVVHAVREVSIHGDRYFDVDMVRPYAEAHAGPDAGHAGAGLLRVRVAAHTVTSHATFAEEPGATPESIPLRVGDRIAIEFLMGQVTGVRIVARLAQ